VVGGAGEDLSFGSGALSVAVGEDLGNVKHGDT